MSLVSCSKQCEGGLRDHYGNCYTFLHKMCVVGRCATHCFVIDI